MRQSRKSRSLITHLMHREDPGLSCGAAKLLGQSALGENPSAPGGSPHIWKHCVGGLSKVPCSRCPQYQDRLWTGSGEAHGQDKLSGKIPQGGGHAGSGHSWRDAASLPTSCPAIRSLLSFFLSFSLSSETLRFVISQIPRWAPPRTSTRSSSRPTMSDGTSLLLFG